MNFSNNKTIRGIKSTKLSNETEPVTVGNKNRAGGGRNIVL